MVISKKIQNNGKIGVTQLAKVFVAETIHPISACVFVFFFLIYWCNYFFGNDLLMYLAHAFSDRQRVIDDYGYFVNLEIYRWFSPSEMLIRASIVSCKQIHVTKNQMWRSKKIWKRRKLAYVCSTTPGWIILREKNTLMQWVLRRNWRFDGPPSTLLVLYSVMSVLCSLKGSHKYTSQ